MELCDRKIGKLARRKTADTTTVLLIESDDIALMSPQKMEQVIEAAYPKRPPGVDQVWYVSTAIPQALEFFDFTRLWQ